MQEKLTKEDISYQLRKYLAQNSLSQTDLANSLQVNISQLNRWIMGRNETSPIWQRHLVSLKILDPELETPVEYRELPKGQVRA